MNNSVILPTPCEFINLTPLNPLIAKCQIKVCWVGDEPNRNGSVITKEVATEMANSLPGSPIVGFYDDSIGDFKGHERELVVENGEIYFKDITRPYGFVDLNARVWFQKFSDDGVVHEYLMTEGWLWVGQYPECRRVLEQGNNQSMELDEKLTKAHWAKGVNENREFFIINEAIMSKLCILGQAVEPCFEGAQITKVQYSLDKGFKEELFSMMNEIKQILSEGGTSMEDNTPVVDPVVDPVPAPADPEPAVNPEPVVDPAVEPAEPAPADPEPTPVDPEPAPVDPEPQPEPAVEPAAAYNLEEIPEYTELRTQYSELETRFNALQEENNSLVAFKAGVEKTQKEELINSFSMLTDEDKRDVRENIDTYSLEDIEAKLSIICVRNKVNFSLNDNSQTQTGLTVNLPGPSVNDETTPAWIRAVQAVAENN